MSTGWTSASPSHRFRRGTVLFRTNNSAGICAGYSQTWLTLSLIAGRPHTNPGMMHNVSHIGAIHQGQGGAGFRNRAAPAQHIPLGGPSVQTLPESGLVISTGYPVQLAWTGWDHIFQTIVQQGQGHYYLTMKVPSAHAMACIVTPSHVFHLEPQFGLVQFGRTDYAEGATTFYSQYGFAQNNGFKIYQVTQA